MNEQKAAQTSTALSLSLKTILTWLGAIVLAVAGGTFALTKLSTSSRVAALQTELEGTKVRLNEKDDAILRLKAAYPGLTERHEVAIKVLPDATLNAAKDDPELSRLADRINDLEKERYALLSNLAKLSQNALDPSSELSNLLSQLSAESEMGRADAVRGLFDLRDHRAFNSLVSYFKSKPEEATRAKTIGEWYRLLFKMDSKAALEFMVQQLESDETLHSEYAYDRLNEEDLSPELLNHGIAQLESVALRSPNTLARTRAKILLQRFKERVENPKNHLDALSLFRVLLDIEKEVKQLTHNSKKAEQTNALDSATAAPSEAPQSE